VNGVGEPRAKLPRAIWMLGFVSMFMDVSSEMIHALLPLFLVTTLGASTLALGVLEGVAEATANITKIFSGVLSDWLRRRKLLAVIGYSMGAASKPLFAVAGTIGHVFAARFIDRVGKGIRGAPRDALVADVTPAHMRGAAFGLRQALDNVGAFSGPLLAIALMALTANSFRTVFWIAAIPGAIAVLVLVLGVHEPAEHADATPRRAPRFSDAGSMGRAFWAVVAIAVVLTLARFSEAFLVLRAMDLGLGIALAPVVMVVMNVVYASTSYPAGRLADRVGKEVVLAAGLVVLIVADLALARAHGIALGLVGVALWGLHLGATQGLLGALVADTAPADLRGSAFGLFNLAIGVAMLAASVVAGALWQARGPAATFHAGAAFTALALVGMLVLRPRMRLA
jgi:MFS family permease